MDDKIILKAEFSPRVCSYWLTSGTLVMMLTVVGIPLLPFWLIGGFYLTRRYLSRMECILTERSLMVNKGMWVRTEKTIPLDKITDLGLVQGPVMRYFGIRKLSVETAGQSSEGALVDLLGILDVEGFKETVLRQRDQLREAPKEPKPEATESGLKGDSLVLNEIKESLFRIEGILKDRD